MFGSRALIFITICILAVSYISYIKYPEACDYPLGIKAYYSATKILTFLADLSLRLGGKYLTPYRISEHDYSAPVEGIEVSIHKFGGVKTTVITPTGFGDNGGESAIIYYHGGGWALGGIATYAAYLKKLSKESGMVVIVPEYRLAPENPYPIPFEDCLHATLAFVNIAKTFKVNPKKIVLAGDSAGGNLATAIALRLTNTTNTKLNPCMLNVVYPVLQMSNFMLPSYQQNRNPPLLTPPIMAHFFLLYIGLEKETELITPMTHNLHMEGIEDEMLLKRTSSNWIPDTYKKREYEKPKLRSTENEIKLLESYKKKLQKFANDTTFAPLSASDEELKLLPRTHILTCEYDILRDDGIILYERMKKLKLDVSQQNLEFGAHGLLSLYGAVTYDKLENAVAYMISQMKHGLSKC
uniref:arylacetamide deacetylase-like n=1 Tax=Styela clava TaxID=7725 RepID=UPI001939C0D0|nr:arylacetamide deacetylase-like [Styela clava]